MLFKTLNNNTLNNVFLNSNFKHCFKSKMCILFFKKVLIILR